MKNILVTGGAGFIGSHTVVELHVAGYKPVIVDNFSNSDKSVIGSLEKIIGDKVDFYEGEFQDKQLVKEIAAKHNIDGVIHFAAYKAVGESVEKPLKYFRNNVAGLVDLLEVMQELGIDNLVFSSSCTIYGEPDKLPVTEESPQKPANSPYGATKQMCETIIKDTVAAGPDLRAISLRYFNPIGAHSTALIGELPKGVPSNLVPFLTQTVTGIRDNLTVFGNDYPTSDGTCIRDYIHVVDLAKAHINALEHLTKQSAKFYDIFNVGTGKGTSVLELIKCFEEATGQKVPFQIGLRRAGDVVAAYASVEKISRELGWKAEYDLAQALKDAWHWQQKLKEGKK